MVVHNPLIRPAISCAKHHFSVAASLAASHRQPNVARSFGPSFSVLHDRTPAWKEGAEGRHHGSCDGGVTVVFFCGAIKGSTPFLAFWCSFCFENVVVSTPKW